MRRAELADLVAAAAVNSQCAAQPIGGIDDLVFESPSPLTDVLAEAWKTVPWDEI